jgi:hypothetical protein
MDVCDSLHLRENQSMKWHDHTLCFSLYFVREQTSYTLKVNDKFNQKRLIGF